MMEAQDRDYREAIEQIDADEGRGWDSPDVLVGDQAVEASRALLARVGHPSLGHGNATGCGRSPKRQVRLPEELNDRLDRFTAAHNTNASQIMRRALEDYLDRVDGDGRAA
ncbi:Hypothetical protein PFCIRM516_09645 [Propionibacterium freudenreichii]|uniref:ribbon-helix-helix protein, CopG family n=1 Tax=Propionibacterium freudenreichii TaxID=1744 RepID=UPI0005A5CA6C|nr:ribbon-helix-helix protein, CopG family [Propionibacterium freudenreichii]CEI27560.1 Hypothetical protein PFCIRM516_09645 [Propionibacterium freudenreichii]CEI30349.1 Hypothetical protein PFCIRM456_09050 [Propionibacterium freudenreichii]